MFRLIVAFLLFCWTAPGWAQTPSSPPATTTRPAVKKPAPKAKAAQKLAQPAESGPCRIGVIPAIGEQITVQKVGLMVFGNALDEVTAGGWGLDDLVVARVRAAAGGNGVRRIAFANGAFKNYGRAPGLAFQNVRTQLNDIVQQVTAGTHCERYVLVTPTSSRFAGTNQGVTGIGVVHWDSILSRAYVFSLTYIRVFDGQTFDVIKQDIASIDGHSILYQAVLGDIIRGPFRQFDATSFPATPPDVLNNAAIRDDVRTLLATSLDKTLPGLLQQ